MTALTSALRPRRESGCVTRSIAALVGDLLDAREHTSGLRELGVRAEVRPRRVRSGDRVVVVFAIIRSDVHYAHEWRWVDPDQRVEYCSTCHRLRVRP